MPNADFTPTPEAVEAVAKAFYGLRKVSWEELGLDPVAAQYQQQARAAIAAFMEAEGLKLEIRRMEDLEQRLYVGPWRKRD